jgi:MFS transporter, DHA1 family, multidrug resistance protein
MKTKTHPNTLLIIILGLLTALAPLSTDMYLPAFPSIAENLHTDISNITLSLSVFFVGVAVGQLFYGPLLERFGRKKPLYAGLLIFILGTIACGSALSINFLIFGRLLQALGGCVGMVAARAIIRDMFPIEQNAKIFSMLMLVTSVSPIIAPSLGGMIAGAMGWRFIFVILALLALVGLLAAYFYLPESHQPDENFSLQPMNIIHNYSAVLKNRQFMMYTIVGSIGSIGMFSYISSAPSIFLNHFQMGQKEFGWMIGAISIGVVSAGQINNILLSKFKMKWIAVFAGGIQTFLGILFLSVAFSGLSNIVITVGFISVLLACLGFIFPNSNSLAMAPMNSDAGDASAMIGALQMITGAAASAFISSLAEKSIILVASIMTVSAAASFILLMYAGKKIMPT